VLDLLTDVVAKAGDLAYAEARFEHRTGERLEVRNGAVHHAGLNDSAGIGIRVRVGAAWGFAATQDVTPQGAQRALGRAIALAQAQPARAVTGLAPVGPAIGSWSHPVAIDPFGLALEDKLAHLLAAEEAMRGDRRVVRTSAESHAARIHKAFVSTEGARCTQDTIECGGGIMAVAVNGAEAQTRTYPSSHGGDVAQAGWEHVLALDLPGNAARVAAEAVELLTAPPCPAAVTTLILHPEQLALQIHESIGHALELDRMLLGEASYAGTSWVAPADLGSLRYGSELLNITADATLPGGLGSFGWDDEGVAAARTPLITAGVLQAALSDRAAAAAIGLPASGGCARADGFARQTITRMTNVSIEPGTAGTLADLIADTDDGVLMESNRSWSIDDRRLHFQFGTEVAREIRGGTLGRLLRNPSYAGVTPTFWGSLDAVCSASEWRPWGLTNCGKGEPGQMMRVSHGAAPARFRGVQVGVT